MGDSVGKAQAIDEMRGNYVNPVIETALKYVNTPDNEKMQTEQITQMLAEPPEKMKVRKKFGPRKHKL